MMFFVDPETRNAEAVNLTGSLVFEILRVESLTVTHRQMVLCGVSGKSVFKIELAFAAYFDAAVVMHGATIGMAEQAEKESIVKCVVDASQGEVDVDFLNELLFLAVSAQEGRFYFVARWIDIKVG